VDRRGGFERGGWVTQHVDKETMAFLKQVYQRADAFLLGRRTYEIFAGSCVPAHRAPALRNRLARLKHAMDTSRSRTSA
jgi:hypothetical protein